MFLTRAFEIINKEGFLTFKYALGQKMRENMTDEKIYQLYIKNVEPRQNAISENQCVQVVSVKENNTVKQVMEAAEKVSTEYVVLCSADYELCENYEKKVSHYILIQKKAGRNLQYIYSDSDIINDNGKRENPDCKPDYSWNTLLSFNYIGNVFAVKKQFFLHRMNEFIDNFGSDSKFDSYKISLFLLSDNSVENVGHIHQILAHKKADYKEESDTSDYKCLLPELKNKNACVVTDKHNKNVQHIHYPLSENDCVSIIIPSKDNPEILKVCLESIKKYTKHTKYEIVVIDNGSNEDNRNEYKKLIAEFGENASYTYERFDFNFSKMCNIGAKKATGNMLLFLNDDIEIIGQDYEDTDWLSVLAGQAKQESTGAVGAKLLYPDSSYIQHVGVINYESSCFAHLYAKAVDDENIKAHRNYADYDCLCVTGACFMLEKAKFDKAGGFDEAFEVTHNDVDICLTLYEQGYYNVLRNDVVLFHHESFSRGDDEVDEEKNRRNMHARDMTYEKHPKLEKYDPFYSPLLTQTENNYRFGDEIYSVIYRKPQKADRLKPAAGYMEVSPTVKVTETGYHDDMQLRGFAYNGNKVYYNPVIFLLNEQNCYRIKAQSVCDRVFHLRKGVDKNINYAPFFCGIDTTDMESGTYRCAIRANGRYYDAQTCIVINDEDGIAQ